MYLKTSGSPWLRWGARVFDNIAIVLALVAVISWWPQHIPDESDRFWAIPVLLFWIPVEAFFVSRFAATPGKWLFGISILHHDGSRLTFRTAIQRSGSVFLRGMGAGLFAPFTQAWSFWRIARDGETTWDRKYKSMIVWHRRYLRGKPRSGPFLGGFPFPDEILDGRNMKDQLVCARCGLLLPPSSSKCDCGSPVVDAPSLDRARFERQFRNLYLFTNAFTAMGLFAILGSVVTPVDWRGIAQGFSGVSGAWAFWSLVESDGETQACGRRRHVELGAVILSIASFLSSFVGSQFRLDLLFWLVMPASYLWRSCRVASRGGIGTEGR